MDQHPVPQNISTYQFRLVGDMTLKQFLELAAGAGLGVLIYTSPLYSFIKWPLIFLSVFGGIAFAFLPFQERPLDVWIKNFIKSVYSPTLYLWKQQGKLPDFFNYQPQAREKHHQARLTPAQKAQFAEYLQSLPLEEKISNFDTQEMAKLQQINQLIKKNTNLDPAVFKNVPQLKQEIIQAPSVRIRTLKTPAKLTVNLPKTGLPTRPMVEIADSFTPSLQVEIPEKTEEVKPKPLTKPRLAIKKSAKIAKTPSLSKLPIPAPPDYPNAVVGMTLDENGKILPGAIIEIRNKDQLPIRASKTNKLGQFFIATPLPNGEYELETEMEPHVFDIIKFKAEGKILPPIKIQAVTNKN